MPSQTPHLTWDHIHLRSPDPEATAAWFERMLGAQVIRSMAQGKPRIDLKLGGANVFIMPVAPGDNVHAPPVTPYQGLDHFGLDRQRHRRGGGGAERQGRGIHDGAAHHPSRTAGLLSARAAGHLG